jgi:hypothetical protein
LNFESCSHKSFHSYLHKLSEMMTPTIFPLILVIYNTAVLKYI